MRTLEELLKLPKLPDDCDYRYVRIEGSWESNHFEDEEGQRWYTVSYEGMLKRARVPPPLFVDLNRSKND
jgi:hypothetical protein